MRPGVKIIVNDNTTSANSALSSKFLCQVVTDRGKAGVPVEVSTVSEYVRLFGRVLTPTAEEAVTAIQGGARLIINPVHHYSSISDSNSVTGDKANNGGLPLSSLFTVSAVDTGAKTITVSGVYEVGIFDSGDSFTITGSTGNDGTYTVVSADESSFPSVTVEVIESIPDSTADGNVNITEPSPQPSFEATEVGDGYNGTKVRISSPASNTAGVFDLTVEVPNGGETQVIRDVPETVDAVAAGDLNSKLNDVSFIGNIPFTLAIGESTLSGGVRDTSAITITDLIGNEPAKTGIHAFDEISEGFHLVLFGFSDPVLDAKYVSYAEDTVRSAHLFLDNSKSVSDNLDYRNGTGTYAHSALDTRDANYIRGKVQQPKYEDPTANIWLQGAGGYMASVSKKDEANVWFSAAEKRFASYDNVLRTEPLTSAEKDNLYNAGINYIGKDSTGTVKFIGNRTLFRNLTKVSSKKNVADLITWMKRWLKGFGEQYLFQPNDLQLFQDMARGAEPTLRSLVDNRGIFDYVWQGDQDAPNLDSLTINNKSDVLNGRYKVILQFRPVASAEFITLEITATNEFVEVV